MQLTTDGLSAPLNFRQLTENPGERRPAKEIRDTVLELRRGKGMVLNPNDRDTWSAGSFFTNAILPAGKADEGAHRVADELGDEDAETRRRAQARGGKQP